MKKTVKKVATALRYDPLQDDAPKVVASGSGEIAERILSKARELDLPIYTEPDLAQTLVGLKIGGEIPPELYQAVAAILVHIRNLDEKAGKNHN